MRRMRAVAASYSGPPILAWPQSVVAAVRQARMVSIMRVLVSGEMMRADRLGMEVY
jgi:hypothetical protein